MSWGLRGAQHMWGKLSLRQQMNVRPQRTAINNYFIPIINRKIMGSFCLKVIDYLYYQSCAAIFCLGHQLLRNLNLWHADIRLRDLCTSPISSPGP